jgi:hypothetical protein
MTGCGPHLFLHFGIPLYTVANWPKQHVSYGKLPGKKAVTASLWERMAVFS